MNLLKFIQLSRAWRPTPVIPVLRRLSLGDYREFKDNLSYVDRPCLKKQTNEQQQKHRSIRYSVNLSTYHGLSLLIIIAVMIMMMMMIMCQHWLINSNKTHWSKMLIEEAVSVRMMANGNSSFFCASKISQHKGFLDKRRQKNHYFDITKLLQCQHLSALQKILLRNTEGAPGLLRIIQFMSVVHL